jgi:tetratricopeptide (TPR) repeat protein
MIGSRAHEVFDAGPGERALARPRHLAREGRAAEAETAYRAALTERPELDAGWIEWFQLLSIDRRWEAALELAREVETRGGRSALALTLAGAALGEQGRHREGLMELERAVATDPDFAPVWHEIGRAAFRLGEHARALLALDRAFALEPGPETLFLRGQVLRAAGRFTAAEVAFEGSGQTAESVEQRLAADDQIRATRRYAALSTGRPDQQGVPERWFAESGGVPLCRGGSEVPASDAEILQAFVDLARSSGWQFSELRRIDPWAGWSDLAAALELPLARGPLSPDAIPLVTAVRPAGAAEEWQQALRAVHGPGRGLVFVLIQPEGDTSADVAGTFESLVGSRPDHSLALLCARHPESRLRGRHLAP